VSRGAPVGYPSPQHVPARGDDVVETLDRETPSDIRQAPVPERMKELDSGSAA